MVPRLVSIHSATCSMQLNRFRCGWVSWWNQGGLEFRVVLRDGEEAVEVDEYLYSVVGCCSVANSCLTLFDPMNCSPQTSLCFTISQSLLNLMSIESVMPSNHLLDLVNRSNCWNHLSFPSSLALNLSQHQGLFHWVGFSHQVAKVLALQLQHQSFQWIFRVDYL